MKDFIKKIRKGSREQRERVTLFLSLAITGIIALVWGTVMLPRTLSSHNSNKAQSSSPLSVLIENFSTMAEDAKKGWGEIQQVFDSDESGEEEKEEEGETKDQEELPAEGSRGEVIDEEESEEVENGGGSATSEEEADGEKEEEIKEDLRSEEE